MNPRPPSAADTAVAQHELVRSNPMAPHCQGTLGLPCGRTVDLLAGGQLISLSAVG